MSAKIHPKALVDPCATLGFHVEVGPFAVIGPEVTIGERTSIQSHAVIEGTVTIGSENVIGPGCVIGAPPQDLSYSPETKSGVRIGNRNVFREVLHDSPRQRRRNRDHNRRRKLPHGRHAYRPQLRHREQSDHCQ